MLRTLSERSPKIILDDGSNTFPDDWSPDGRWILCRQLRGEKITVIQIPIDGGKPSKPLFETTNAMDQLQISPDGQWLAYNSDESGRWEVYIARFPAMTEARTVSKNGGCQPIWRKDGQELFYLAPDAMLMSVPLTKSPSLQPGIPKALFQTRIPILETATQYAVTANGQKFLLIENEPPRPGVDSRDPLHVVINWQAGLRR